MSDQDEKLEELLSEVKGLRRQISELKREVREPGRTRFRGIRKRSETTLFGVPIYDIALGPDFEKGEMRGTAKGIIAIGDVAFGLVALGGVALGGLASGGLAIGILGAAGGAAIGAFAAGGAAVGAVAVGGAAVGLVALGGATFSLYTWNELITLLLPRLK